MKNRRADRWRDFEQGLDASPRMHRDRRKRCISGAAIVQTCNLSTKEAQDLQKRVNLFSLAKNPELRNEAMQLVSRIEDAASQICGPATGLDQALILIEKRHEGNNP